MVWTSAGTFCASVAASILFVVGLIKLISIFGSGGILNVPDPIFGVSFRSIMVITGLIEVVSAGILLFTKNKLFAGSLALSLALEFIIYHGFAKVMQPGFYCPCLGSLGQSLGLDQVASTRLALTIAKFLVVLSAATIISAWLARVTGGSKRG